MKNIRAELDERLAMIDIRREAEQERHEGELQKLDRDEETIKAMIALEDKLAAVNGHTAMSAPQQKPLLPGAANQVESEILHALSNCVAWSHGDIKLKLIGAGLGSEKDPQFGRSLQGTLLSMRGRELVEKAGEAMWRITQRGMTGEMK